MKVPERIIENAKRLNQDYASANQILHMSMNDAMAWAVPLATRGIIPPVDRIERLATQCMAILMATYPDDFASPIKGFTNG